MSLLRNTLLPEATIDPWIVRGVNTRGQKLHVNLTSGGGRRVFDASISFEMGGKITVTNGRMMKPFNSHKNSKSNCQRPKDERKWVSSLPISLNFHD